MPEERDTKPKELGIYVGDGSEDAKTAAAVRATAPDVHANVEVPKFLLLTELALV